jgi:hypothetical protein
MEDGSELHALMANIREIMDDPPPEKSSKAF